MEIVPVEALVRQRSAGGAQRGSGISRASAGSVPCDDRIVHMEVLPHGGGLKRLLHSRRTRDFHALTRCRDATFLLRRLWHRHHWFDGFNLLLKLISGSRCLCRYVVGFSYVDNVVGKVESHLAEFSRKLFELLWIAGKDAGMLLRATMLKHRFLFVYA